MAISTILDTMLLNIAGNSFIAALLILAAFAYLCFKKNLGVAETFIVVFPVMLGLTLGDDMPKWFSGLVIIGVGILWGLALTKAFNSTEPYIKSYVVFLSVSAALSMFDNISYSCAIANMQNLATSTTGSWYSSIDNILREGSKIASFMLGGTIKSFFNCLQLPSIVNSFFGLSIQAYVLVMFLAFIQQFFSIFTYWKQIVIGAIILVGGGYLVTTVW